MGTPLVSILTPVFNAEDYIEEVLAAVADQTYSAIEHIVIDDGSSDRGPDLIRRFAAQRKGERVRFLRQDNAGEAVTVNRAFTESSGQYVIVVNADDPPYPGLVEAAVEALERDPGLVVAYPDWEMIDAAGEVMRVVETLPYSQQALIADYVCLPGPGAMIRAAAVCGEPLRNTDYRYVSDYELWLRLSLVGGMCRVPRVLARWRNHAGGATAAGRGEALASEFIDVIDEFFRRDDLPPHVRAWRRQARAMAAYHAAIQGLHDPAVPARRFVLRSLLTPFVRRARYNTVRRSPLVVAAILTRPLSTMVMERHR